MGAIVSSQICIRVCLLLVLSCSLNSIQARTKNATPIAPQPKIDTLSTRALSNAAGSLNPNVSPVSFQGYFDSAGCDKIYGWAWDSSAPNSSIDVVIWDGTNYLATVPANEYRSDLPGNKYHAFNYVTPASLKNGVAHSIRVTISGYPSIELTNSPKSLTCTATLPGPPTPLSPGAANDPGLTISTTTPSFQWSGVTGADGYGLYISLKDSSGSYNLIFDSEVRYGGPIAGSSLTLPSGVLSNGNQYRWNMRSHNSAGWGTSYSGRLYFNVMTTQLPSPPALIGPGTNTEPGQTISTITPTFQWSSVNGADGYGLYISLKDSSGSYNLIFDSEARYGGPITGNSLNLPSGVLTNAGQYRWNMRCHNSAGWGTTFSSKFYFNVSTQSFQGYLDGADCTKIYGWAWDSNAPNSSIDVVIWDGTNYLATVPANEYRADLLGNKYHAFNYVTPSSLKNGTSHSIRVTISGYPNIELTNSPRSLNCSTSVVGPPTPLLPGAASEPGLSVSTTTPTFQWTGVTGADGYGLYISLRDSSGNYNLVFDSEVRYSTPITGSTLVLPSDVLSNGNQYRWNMRSHSSAGWGTSFSGKLYFSVNTGSVSTPTISNTPPSGPQLTTTFTTTGTGFTPNGQVQRFLTFPNQATPQEISRITADSQGNFSFPFSTDCSTNVGTYSMYTIDVGSNRQSNSITQTVTASTSCNPPTISVSPSSGAQGINVTITGSKFTPNGQVRRFTTFPNGVTYEFASTVANSSGQISVSVPTDCTTALGSYTTFMKDVSSNSESIRQSNQITASSSCSSTASLQVAPASATLGTSFNFSGMGFTRNSTATLAVTRADGQPGNGGRYNTDSSGNVSFVITSLQSDPIGQWTFRMTDDSTGKQASATAQYTSNQPSGTDEMYYTASTVDVTIPDNTQFAPGEIRNKVWRIQNSGTNGWNSYRLVFVSGSVNGNVSSLLSPVSSLTINASPGQWINTPNLTITAPNTAGTFYSYWQLQNSAGVNFGSRIYVKIRVVPRQGNALGFGNQTGQSGTNDSPPAKSGRNADPVNTATGNYNYESTDLNVPGRGIDVTLGRSYNSQDGTVGAVGRGWSHTFNVYLTNIGSTTVSVHYSDGKVLDYINQTGTNTYSSAYPGYYDLLTKNGDGSWSLTKSDQRTYNFDSSGRLTAIRDRNSNQLSLDYSGSNLAQVVDSGGRSFAFTYSGALLTRITDPLGRTVQFGYDANSNLVSFRDANNNLNTYSYDNLHRLTKIVDGRNNNLLVNSYDSNNRVVTQANGRGNQWTFVYSADGSTSVFDPLSKETKYLHDTNFNMERTQDRNANSINLLYDERNNRAQVSDLKGNYSSYSYDSTGNITTLTDPTLSSRQVSYDSKNNPTQVVDEVGSKTQVTYDTNGNPLSVIDPLSHTSSTTYDQFGQPLTSVDPNGNVTTNTYDAQGNLVTVRDPLGNTTTYTYDSVGRRISMTNARAKTTRYSYDANGNLLTVTTAAGNVTNYSYDANNNRISMRDARGNTTTYEYDENNLLLKETDAKGNFTQNSYDKLDRRVSSRDKRGNTTSFSYDDEGRLLSVTDPLGNVIRYAYDANGNRTSVTDPKGQTSGFTYDALNRLTRVQDPFGNIVQKEYDAAGRLIREVDPRDNVTKFNYDAAGNLTQVSDSAGGTAKYTYDNNRNRIAQTDPNNHTSNLAYDKLNRLLSAKDALNNAYSYTYDEVGNRVSQTDAKKQTIRYSYDDDNRLRMITYPDNSSVQLSYDANNNITQMVDSLGTTSYVYDELNRLTSHTDPFGKTVGYQYDANGNISRLSYPDGKQVNYLYDGNNRLISFTDWANKTTTYQYDSTNLLTRIVNPNGIVTNLTYDNAGRLIGKADAGVSSYNFTLDRNGNRTSASITQPIGNRLANVSQNYTYDASNRIQTQGASTFGFDANGNMTSRNETARTSLYGYDFENRLKSVSDSTQYFYDGQGVRLQKIEGTKTTRYTVDVNHDLSQVLCETDGNGIITAYYVYGNGLTYKVSPDGKHYYYHFDPIGSTIAMTDNAKNVVNSYAYDPFGSATNKVESTSNPFQFVGQYGVTRDTNGLLFMRARYYATDVGRFLTRDPVKGKDNSTQNLNSYAYVSQNPTINVDPSGALVFSEGIQGHVALVFGGTLQGAIVADDRGNHGIAYSYGVTGGSAYGFAGGAFISVTTDQTINDLNGKSYSLDAGGGILGHANASLLIDRNGHMNGLSIGVGTGIDFDIGGSVSWGKVAPLTRFQYLTLLYQIGPVAAAPLIAFDVSAAVRNYYSRLINDAGNQLTTRSINQQSGPMQPRGPGSPNPVGRPTKTY